MFYTYMKRNAEKPSEFFIKTKPLDLRQFNIPV